MKVVSTSYFNVIFDVISTSYWRCIDVISTAFQRHFNVVSTSKFGWRCQLKKRCNLRLMWRRCDVMSYRSPCRILWPKYTLLMTQNNEQNLVWKTWNIGKDTVMKQYFLLASYKCNKGIFCLVISQPFENRNTKMYTTNWYLSHTTRHTIHFKYLCIVGIN